MRALKIAGVIVFSPLIVLAMLLLALLSLPMLLVGMASLVLGEDNFFEWSVEHNPVYWSIEWLDSV